VVPNFILQALQGEDLTVYGDGLQTRSFCYVDDLVEGISRLLFSQETQPVNLGNPREFSILEFAGKIMEIAGSRSKVIRKPLPEDDPRVRRPDISRATAILGWCPRIEVTEGIRRTIPYFRERQCKKP
jgi:dTDP-glucose 4,6-dehydratase